MTKIETYDALVKEFPYLDIWISIEEGSSLVNVEFRGFNGDYNYGIRCEIKKALKKYLYEVLKLNAFILFWEN